VNISTFGNDMNIYKFMIDLFMIPKTILSILNVFIYDNKVFYIQNLNDNIHQKKIP
jgi:hypothetical protein